MIKICPQTTKRTIHQIIKNTKKINECTNINCEQTNGLRITPQGKKCYKCLKPTDLVRCDICEEFQPYKTYTPTRKLNNTIIRKKTCKECEYMIKEAKKLQNDHKITINPKTKKITLKLQTALQFMLIANTQPNRLEPLASQLYQAIINGNWSIK